MESGYRANICRSLFAVMEIRGSGRLAPWALSDVILLRKRTQEKHGRLFVLRSRFKGGIVAIKPAETGRICWVVLQTVETTNAGSSLPSPYDFVRGNSTSSGSQQLSVSRKGKDLGCLCKRDTNAHIHTEKGHLDTPNIQNVRRSL